MTIKIKITITRKPSKIGNHFRKTFKSFKGYIRSNITDKIKNCIKNLKEKLNMSKTKLKLFMEENDVSEDYILDILATIIKPKVNETPTEEPETTDTTEAPEKPDIKDDDKPDISTDDEEKTITLGEKVEKFMTKKIAEAVRVQRKAAPKKTEHTKTPPEYNKRPEMWV